MSENRDNLLFQEQEVDKNIQRLNEEKKFKQKEEKKIAKDIKISKKRTRQDDLGKYYFWEFNKNNYSLFKIIQTYVFSIVTLLFSISLFLTPVFAVSEINGSIQVFIWITSSFVVLFAILNYFAETISSNLGTKSSLLLQRTFGIFFSLILFSSFTVMLLLLIGSSNDPGSALNIAILTNKGWLIFDILFLLVLVLFKVFYISFFLEQKQ